ncbi:MAG: capsule assembly Wzi family protein [Candidatus Eisenbacteria bacterium]
MIRLFGVYVSVQSTSSVLPPLAAVALAAAIAFQPMPAAALSVVSDCMVQGSEASGLRLDPRPPADLPLDHWAYPLLTRLVARGLLELDLTTLPVSRAQVASALAKRAGRAQSEASRGAAGSAGEDRDERVSERERWALSILTSEFLHGRVDEPLLVVRSRESALGLGFVFGSEVSCAHADVPTTAHPHDTRPHADVPTTAHPPDTRPLGEEPEDEFSVSGTLSYELWGGVGENLGFYADSTILLEKQDGPRTERLSSRARTWRGFSVSADRAYVRYERENLGIAIGRRGAAWGRSPRGRLLVSGTAPTLDGVEARFRVGSLTLQALHAFLERAGTDGAVGDTLRGDRVFLAAHRAVFSCSWGSLGLGEAVVYSGSIPDPAYLNPLLPYYVSQHNERANDNILWSLDFAARPVRGLEVWGEFLVDDLQYDRDTGHPDKYGATVGAAYYGTFDSKDWELTCEYTNVRKWTYTHHVTEHRHTHDGRPLGFELGPDADRAVVELVYHPSALWGVSAGYSFSREGEGSATVPFVEGEDDEPTFPSGDVLYGHRTAMSLGYEDPGGLCAQFGGAFVLGWSDLRNEDSYEFWARVRFRI